jgi:hypothetical protein
VCPLQLLLLFFLLLRSRTAVKAFHTRYYTTIFVLHTSSLLLTSNHYFLSLSVSRCTLTALAFLSPHSHSTTTNTHTQQHSVTKQDNNPIEQRFIFPPKHHHHHKQENIHHSQVLALIQCHRNNKQYHHQIMTMKMMIENQQLDHRLLSHR